ncbi:hypothetical protein ACEYYH_04115 [Microbacterium trichothecenolyticum]|uniref:hypothetical protein n=1 Tax=Microbacterium trichothecenolyticum TaxID=69370 RepID=UPI0035BE25A8
MDIAAARALLQPRGRLEATGLSSRRIAAEVAEGRLRHIHRGVYVDGEVWRGLYAEDRHLLRVVAVHDRSRGADVVPALTSAVVLHGLPLYRLEPRLVHLFGSRADGHVRTGDRNVARHRIAVPEEDQDVVDGIRCTNLARTVADFIRAAPETAGISVADAALRRLAWDDGGHSYDVDAAGAFVAAVGERLDAAGSGRGIRRGRRIISIADGRAQLPGESVSRLHLLALGFATPRLQVPIAAPDAGWYYVDFGLDDVDAWGEFDGIGKYFSPEILGDSDTQAAFLAEKQREDWIRGTTNRRYPRWGTPHIASAAALAERLASFHIAAP